MPTHTCWIRSLALTLGAGARQDPSGTNSFSERAVIALGLGRIPGCKFHDPVGEGFHLPTVTGNWFGIPLRAGARASTQPESVTCSNQSAFVIPSILTFIRMSWS
jgi:hypothetical protein